MGDLLRNVLRVERTFWEDHAHLKARLDAVLEGLQEPPAEIQEALQDYRRLKGMR